MVCVSSGDTRLCPQVRVLHHETKNKVTFERTPSAMSVCVAAHRFVQFEPISKENTTQLSDLNKSIGFCSREQNRLTGTPSNISCNKGLKFSLELFLMSWTERKLVWKEEDQTFT